jgi:hypothetical protein
MKAFLSVLMLSLLLLFTSSDVSAANNKRNQAKQRDIYLMKYASAVRWTEFEMAWGYLDPEYRLNNPLTDLEKERFKQIQVTGYEVKTMDTLPNGNIEQVVEIRLINRNTQAERSILDTQIWRYDDKAKRWWLISGLPNTAGR